MNADISVSAMIRHVAESATHPLARPVARLALSFVVAGISLPPPLFAPATRPDAPSDAFNYGF